MPEHAKHERRWVKREPRKYVTCHAAHRRALSPLSGGCCCWRAGRCGFSPGVVILVLLLHRVLCLCCECGLSCVPCTWVWRYRLGVHLIPCAVTCACAPYTGLAGSIPLALGFGVSWVLLARCFWGPAPAQVVSCSPMPVVSSVNQVAAHQVGSHPASVGLVDHVLHGTCPNDMTLGSQRRAVAF